MSEGGEHFDWSLLVPLVVNPTKVAVIEALHYVDRPMSATELAKTLERGVTVPSISYHLRTLDEAGVIKKVRECKVRGAKEKFYVLIPTQHTNPKADRA